MTPQEWIAHDPDPVTAAELRACSPGELAARFAAPLRFGTAGLRGPVRGGPDAMNLAVVLRASWAVARVLSAQGRGGSTVVVGGDARHGSAEYATATAEVLAAAGFSVLVLPQPCPTPVVAFAVRHTGAAAGIQITASHNPAGDNGYKVYFDGGVQIVSPTDTEIEAAMAAAPPADAIARRPVAPAGDELVTRYIGRAAMVRRHGGRIRVALTPLHGVGGKVAVEVLRAAGISDIHTVTSQFDPDPDFPTVTFPNPEEPGATDALLKLAAEVDADVAIALDPDADRCAVGICGPHGWQMLTGNETGWLLGDYLLSWLPAGRAAGVVVASSVVSSRMLVRIAQRYGARHVETLTGFKWLARADNALPGATLVYAYEEAIGYCVDPEAVRDKDGISAAALVCDLVAALADQGSSVPEALDELARRHGVHVTDAVTRRVANPAEAAAVMARLRADTPETLAGFAVTATDLLRRPGPVTDALEFTGERNGSSVRVVVRPSGTEPKLKCYLEVARPPSDDLAGDRAEAQRVCGAVADAVRSW